MRKIIGSLFQSLDGVIQAPGGPEEDQTGFAHGGWVFPYFDDSLDGPMGRLLGGSYELLLGRRTYDIFAAYWPYNQGDPIGSKFERINKYVLTHSGEPLEWENSHRLSGETPEAVAELKASEGRDLLIQGSSTLYVPLLAAGLIDRLILMIFPIVLGRGKRIFDGSQSPGGFKLVDHFVSDRGVAFMTYEPAGEVPTGSFVGQEPSEAELKRRETWAKQDA
jgi:dihydrofolate reductase